jgi:hypothetical protein
VIRWAARESLLRRRLRVHGQCHMALLGFYRRQVEREAVDHPTSTAYLWQSLAWVLVADRLGGGLSLAGDALQLRRGRQRRTERPERRKGRSGESVDNPVRPAGTANASSRAMRSIPAGPSCSRPTTRPSSVRSDKAHQSRLSSPPSQGERAPAPRRHDRELKTGFVLRIGRTCRVVPDLAGRVASASDDVSVVSAVWDFAFFSPACSCFRRPSAQRVCAGPGRTRVARPTRPHGHARLDGSSPSGGRKGLPEVE